MSGLAWTMRAVLEGAKIVMLGLHFVLHLMGDERGVS